MKTNLLLFFLIIFLSGCKKYTDQHYYLTDNDKKYAAFQKGSYWIYQNDSTLSIDSVSVDSLELGTSEHYDYDTETKDYHEYFNCFAKFVIDTNFRIEYRIQANLELDAYVIRFSNHEHDTSWYTQVYLKKSNGEDQFYTVGIYQYLINPLNNFVVNATAYNNVYNFKTGNNSSSGSYFALGQAEVFVVKNIGIIKWKVHYSNNSSESWSLLRSHIVF